MYINLIITILAGLVIGSFLNVIILRVDNLKSVLNTRSHCPHCQKEIKWYDLVPLISFILLRGKCRFCQKDISWQYPIVEAGTAAIFAAIFLKFGMSWASAYYALVFMFLIVIFVYDIKTQYILDIVSWPMLIICLAGGWYFGHFDLLSSLYGILSGGGILALLVVISHERWMGIGDIIIGSALGALLGFPRSTVFIFMSFIIGSIVGIVLMGLKKKTVKDAVPFAPFLISAAFIALFWGQYLIDWYLGIIYIG